MSVDVQGLTATALSQRLADGRLSASELMQATLARIAEVNPGLNAIVSLRDADRLMAEARAAENQPRKGWLHGIPIAIKDLANAEGLPTSMGSPLFAGQVAARDDLHVARLRAAGAIIIGKTNTPEFGLGSHTFNPVHGATCNPYAPDRTCGGSSGGAAVALAAGLLSVADGSDMMGSLRNPAGWNNVYGMRPSWGLVPSEPQGDTFLHQLATNGPMARAPSDLRALLRSMAGPDPRQPHPGEAVDLTPEAGRQMTRMAWLGDWGGALPFEDGILDLMQDVLRRFSEIGISVEAPEVPFSREALWDSWTCLRHFSVAAGLGSLFEAPERRGQLKDTALWEIENGLRLSAMDIHKASLTRSEWFAASHDLFQRFDVLALPTAQVWPFPMDQAYPKEIAGQQMDTYHRWMEVMIPASLIGLPVVAVPAGFGANGLPMGLQLVGPRGSDGRLLDLAERWHDATDWPGTRPPAL